MYHFLICDDDPAQQETNQRLVWQFAKNKKIDLKLTCFSSAEAFLFHYDQDKSGDVLLLDIEMGKMDGVTLAKKIRQGNKEIQIIFITGYMEYILDGYEVEALHYLLKPIAATNLFPVLERALSRLKDNTKALFVKHQDEGLRIPHYEISYLEVMGNYVTIHANGIYKVKATLGHFENELGEQFFRVGRPYLINLKVIKMVGKGQLTLMDGTVLPLPRGADKKINQAIIERL